MRRARVRRVTRVSLSHSQRDLVAQEVGVMHQVAHTSPLKSLFDSSQLSGSINVQDGGRTSFLKTIHGSRSKIRLVTPPPMLDVIFVGSFPQRPPKS